MTGSTQVAVPGCSQPAFSAAGIEAIATEIRQPIHVVMDANDRRVGLARAQTLSHEVPAKHGAALSTLASLGASYPEWLGDRSFAETHGCRFPYVVGEMARGIATAQMVVTAGRSGLLGFFGSAGLMPDAIEPALNTVGTALDPEDIAWGANLIHSPQEPELERAVTDLFLAWPVRRVSASAFMSLTSNVVRYACRGLHTLPDGRIVRRNHLFAKVSRPEVARHFMAPPPEAMLIDLVARGEVSQHEADLARRLPLAGDVTVEADSGGHTDNRPLAVLMPVMSALRDELMARHEIAPCVQVRLGAAGGIGCPSGAAAAFALGAAYVLTGTVNQAAVESGLSYAGRSLLAQADVADVTMAPAADMFELGVKLQVLKRGTLFAARANSLYGTYREHDSLESLPAPLRARLEHDVFGQSLDDVWTATRDFFCKRRPQEVERAEREPKHRLALVCRWYLGHSSQWAMSGERSRQSDYQIWCGPAMGAFNRWVANTWLEPVEARSVAQIALNLLEGAAVVTRAHQLRCLGVPMPASAFRFLPRPLQ